MSLENLVASHQLHRHAAKADEIAKLLAAAARNIKDSNIDGISNETRFDLGYKAIMQCALVGVMAHGYRPSTTTPGHHRTMIQSLRLTLGVSDEECQVLDSLRKKRNRNDYSGELIESAAVRVCVGRAEDLLKLTRLWLAQHRPRLLTRK